LFRDRKFCIREATQSVKRVVYRGYSGKLKSPLPQKLGSGNGFSWIVASARGLFIISQFSHLENI